MPAGEKRGSHRLWHMQIITILILIVIYGMIIFVQPSDANNRLNAKPRSTAGLTFSRAQ
jgi:hypothetical protein